MRIHAGGFDGVLVFQAGLGCQGNHGQMTQCWRVANGSGGLQAVHIGHMNVHEHDIEGLGFQRLQCAQAIVGGFHAHADQFQKVGCHFAVQCVVIHHQHAKPLELWITLLRRHAGHGWRRRQGGRRGMVRAVGLQNFQNGVEEYGLRHRLDEQTLKTQTIRLTQNFLAPVCRHH